MEGKMEQAITLRENPTAMANDLFDLMSAFTGVGIASRDRFSDAPLDYHPQRLMSDFESIIAYSQGPDDVSQEREMGRFHNLFKCIAAQDNVIQYLKAKGYRAHMISPTTSEVSLPRIGEQAGIGEISGVNSLVVEDHGLATSLGAIITNAPLTPNKPLKNICTECWACVDVCPATDEPFHMNPSRCTACGECVKTCPV